MTNKDKTSEEIIRTGLGKRPFGKSITMFEYFHNLRDVMIYELETSGSCPGLSYILNQMSNPEFGRKTGLLDKLNYIAVYSLYHEKSNNQFNMTECELGQTMNKLDSKLNNLSQIASWKEEYMHMIHQIIKCYENRSYPSKEDQRNSNVASFEWETAQSEGDALQGPDTKKDFGREGSVDSHSLSRKRNRFPEKAQSPISDRATDKNDKELENTNMKDFQIRNATEEQSSLNNDSFDVNFASLDKTTELKIAEEKKRLNEEQEEILQVAKSEAEEILRSARAEAKKIIQSAQSKAEEITQNANDEANRYREDIYVKLQNEADRVKEKYLRQIIASEPVDMKETVDSEKFRAETESLKQSINETTYNIQVQLKTQIDDHINELQKYKYNIETALDDWRREIYSKEYGELVESFQKLYGQVGENSKTVGAIITEIHRLEMMNCPTEEDQELLDRLNALIKNMKHVIYSFEKGFKNIGIFVDVPKRKDVYSKEKHVLVDGMESEMSNSTKHIDSVLMPGIYLINRYGQLEWIRRAAVTLIRDEDNQK